MLRSLLISNSDISAPFYAACSDRSFLLAGSTQEVILACIKNPDIDSVIYSLDTFSLKETEKITEKLFFINPMLLHVLYSKGNAIPRIPENIQVPLP